MRYRRRAKVKGLNSAEFHFFAAKLAERFIRLYLLILRIKTFNSQYFYCFPPRHSMYPRQYFQLLTFDTLFFTNSHTDSIIVLLYKCRIDYISNRGVSMAFLSSS